eukprot:5439716-Amphidinium_carterae.2
MLSRGRLLTMRLAGTQPIACTLSNLRSAALAAESPMRSRVEERSRKTSTNCVWQRTSWASVRVSSNVAIPLARSEVEPAIGAWRAVCQAGQTCRICSSVSGKFKVQWGHTPTTVPSGSVPSRWAHRSRRSWVRRPPDSTRAKTILRECGNFLQAANVLERSASATVAKSRRWREALMRAAVRIRTRRSCFHVSLAGSSSDMRMKRPELCLRSP